MVARLKGSCTEGRVAKKHRCRHVTRMIKGVERSHLNTTQQTTSKGASPPEHREMEAMRVVSFNWLLLAVARAQRLRVSETEGVYAMGEARAVTCAAITSVSSFFSLRASRCTWV